MGGLPFNTLDRFHIARLLDEEDEVKVAVAVVAFDLGCRPIRDSHRRCGSLSAINPYAHPMSFAALPHGGDQRHIWPRGRAAALLLITEPRVIGNGHSNTGDMRGIHQQPFAIHAQLGIVVIHCSADNSEQRCHEEHGEWEHN